MHTEPARSQTAAMGAKEEIFSRGSAILQQIAQLPIVSGIEVAADDYTCA